MHTLAPVTFSPAANRGDGTATDPQPATFRELAEHSRGVVWVRNALDGELTYLNPAYDRLWGRRRNDVQPNAGWIDPIHADDRARVVDALRPAALRQGFREEYRIVYQGQTRWMHDRGVAVPDPDGVVRRIVGIAEDITERRALEQQLVGSQKLEGMGRLAGGIAHDFNNLLTAILGYSESIVRQSDPSDPLRAEAREIQRAGEKAAALTRQLLAFSKRQALKMTVVDLNVIVRDVHQLMKRLIGEHITMDLQLAATLDAVTADSTQLEQILVNLVVNARDAMPEGGRLTVTSATADRTQSDTGAFVIPAGRYTMLTVADTGTGMDAHTRAQIFEPFFTTKDPGKGSGLGLATVYGTVKQLGGYIEVESSIGEGTRFTISLPCTDRPAEPAARRPEVVAAAGRGETVLLVEDDAGVRAFTGHALRSAGYHVLDAESPHAALGLATSATASIDVVLTDVIMPGMNGKQMVTRLERTCLDAKILYMSGYSGTTYFDPSIVDPARERLLEKPFTRDALLRAMRDVLDGTAIISPGDRVA